MTSDMVFAVHSLTNSFTHSLTQQVTRIINHSPGVRHFELPSSLNARNVPSRHALSTDCSHDDDDDETRSTSPRSILTQLTRSLVTEMTATTEAISSPT